MVRDELQLDLNQYIQLRRLMSYRWTMRVSTFGVSTPVRDVRIELTCTPPQTESPTLSVISVNLSSSGHWLRSSLRRSRPRIQVPWTRDVHP